MDLKRLLAQGLLPKERAIAIVSQVAGALDAAHERGLVHRDIKPSNVLLDEREHAYLADFGLSRRLGEPGAALGAAQSLGTIDYAAPEQIRGEQVDGRADLYSLGCLLFECVTGKPPFARPTDSAVLYAHLEEEPPAAPGLEDVMRTALAKEPDDRFQTGRELVEAARKALGLQPRRLGWPVAAAAVGLALIGAALLTFFLTRGGGGVAAVPGADSLVRIDPATNKVAKRTPVGRGASGLAVGAGNVLVTNANDGTLSLVDGKTLKTQTIPVHGTPIGVAVGGGTAVVADGAGQKITGLDPATGAVRYTAKLAGGPYGAAYDFQLAGGRDGIWFADPANRLVGKIDDALISGGPSSQETRIPAPRRQFLFTEFPGLAAADGALWVTGSPLERTLWRLDQRTGRVVSAIRLPFDPKAVAVGEGAVWVTSLLGDTVSRIDPATNRIVATIPVGRGPYSIAAGGGAVWVTSAIDDTVSRIDPSTNRVVAVVPLGGAPGAVAIGPDGPWLTVAKPTPPAPADAIKIGIYADCNGSFAGTYDDSLAGAELALLERGGRPAGPALTDGVDGVKIGGRPVKLYFGCAATTGGSLYTSVLAEERRLVEKVGVDVLIGPTSGADSVALQEYARLHPETVFLNGSGGSPIQTPAPSFFNYTPPGSQWVAGLGTYAYRTLGWRKAVTVTEQSDIFQWSQTAAFIAEFCSLGGTITKRVGIPLTTTDLSSVVTRIPRTGMDGIFLSTIGATLPYLQALEAAVPSLRRGNLSSRLLLASAASPAVPTTTPSDRARAVGLTSAGPGLGGLGSGIFSAAGLAPGSKFRTGFAKHFPRIQVSAFFDVPYYNSMSAALAALDRVHGDLSGGERRFQAALAKVVVNGPTGRISLDAKHRAIAPAYVWQFQGPKLTPRVIRTIPNVDATYGGYFTAHDPPPSLETPACVKRTPPPWAR